MAPLDEESLNTLFQTLAAWEKELEPLGIEEYLGVVERARSHRAPTPGIGD